jgi:hypothetical protein
LIARGRLRTENFTVEREIDQFIRVFRLAVEVRGS